MEKKSFLGDLPDEIDSRLQGSRLSAFISEMLTNSGHFFILNAFSEIAGMGFFHYFTEVGHYIILVAMVIQGWYLSRPQAHRFFGNLSGSLIYTMVDLPLDGWGFFQQFNHVILWGFSLIIATLQGLRFHWVPASQIWVIPLESLTRMIMLFALYLNLASRFQTANSTGLKISVEYRFLLASLILVGLFIGLQTLQVTFQKEKLQLTAQTLKRFAQWGLGNYAVTLGITNPQELECQRKERVILFMDIRGFTPWCEKNTPYQVSNILSFYYQLVEPAATIGEPLKITFTGDEIMAIYTSPKSAIIAAQEMQKIATGLLKKYGLSAGCGIHGGNVVEGVIGSNNVSTYAVIGDVVNTAKRIENATPGGEITISDAIYQDLKQEIEVEYCEPITVKGKSEPLEIWRLKS